MLTRRDALTSADVVSRRRNGTTVEHRSGNEAHVVRLVRPVLQLVGQAAGGVLVARS